MTFDEKIQQSIVRQNFYDLSNHLSTLYDSETCAKTCLYIFGNDHVFCFDNIDWLSYSAKINECIKQIKDTKFNIELINNRVSYLKNCLSSYGYMIKTVSWLTENIDELLDVLEECFKTVYVNKYAFCNVDDANECDSLDDEPVFDEDDCCMPCLEISTLCMEIALVDGV